MELHIVKTFLKKKNNNNNKIKLNINHFMAFNIHFYK